MCFLLILEQVHDGMNIEMLLLLQKKQQTNWA